MQLVGSIVTVLNRVRSMRHAVSMNGLQESLIVVQFSLGHFSIMSTVCTPKVVLHAGGFAPC